MQRFKYRDYDDGTFAIYDRIDDEYYFDDDMEDFCELVNSLNSSLVFAHESRDTLLKLCAEEKKDNKSIIMCIINDMIMDYQAKSIQAIEECRSNRDFHVAQFTLRELIKKIKEGV